MSKYRPCPKRRETGLSHLNLWKDLPSKCQCLSSLTARHFSMMFNLPIAKRRNCCKLSDFCKQSEKPPKGVGPKAAEMQLAEDYSDHPEIQMDMTSLPGVDRDTEKRKR
jgi:hypothetical protein